MIVTRDRFSEVVMKLAQTGHYGLDTETTGVRNEDHIFAIIICDGHASYYFNFNEYPDHLGVLIPLDRRLDLLHYRDMLRIFANPDTTWYIHNAKFDLRMLEKDGLKVAGKVHCTYAIERVLKNNHFGGRPYSLDACAKRIGGQKDKAVDKYITKHRLYKRDTVPGKKVQKKSPQFHLVPFDTMAIYGMQDARLHYELGHRQVRQIDEDLRPVVENELKLLRTCLAMEAHGIKIDRRYVENAIQFEAQSLEKLLRQFQNITDIPYTDSARTLADAFRRAGEVVALSERGNPKLDKTALAKMTTPLANLVKEIREHQKYIATYYTSFLYHANDRDELHPNFNQAGTETGRMSMSNPSLHNIPKEEEGEFRVRRSFVPRQGYYFFMLDYDQQEFRMMLDYAGEVELIEAINSGVDVHQATADLCGISRKQAKTINFGLLYGMGVEKLAKSLGLPVDDARELKGHYFARLPRVQAFIRAVTDRGKNRGHIFNWLGRKCHIDDPEKAYILPNHLIQGGCADVCKVAMNQVHELLKGERSRLILQVHDELLFEIHEQELDIVPALQRIMEQVYPSRNGLRLTASIEYSKISWADKVKGMPSGSGI